MMVLDHCTESNIEYKKVGPRQKRVWGFKGIRPKTTEEFNVPDEAKENE